MINNCRDLHLLSAIVILFLISNSELSLANMNGFPLKMVFIAVEDTNIVILLALLLQLLMLTSQSKQIKVLGSVSDVSFRSSLHR